MRVTRDNIEELQAAIERVEEVSAEIRDACETWLDTEAEKDDRADARDTIEGSIEELVGACNDVTNLAG
jgi:hypothetical protein